MTRLEKWRAAIAAWIRRVTIDDWKVWRKRYSTLSLAVGAILSAAATAAALAAPAAALISIFTVRIVLAVILAIFVAGFIGALLKQPKLHEPEDDSDEYGA